MYVMRFFFVGLMFFGFGCGDPAPQSTVMDGGLTPSDATALQDTLMDTDGALDSGFLADNGLNVDGGLTTYVPSLDMLADANPWLIGKGWMRNSPTMVKRIQGPAMPKRRLSMRCRQTGVQLITAAVSRPVLSLETMLLAAATRLRLGG